MLKKKVLSSIWTNNKKKIDKILLKIPSIANLPLTKMLSSLNYSLFKNSVALNPIADNGTSQ